MPRFDGDRLVLNDRLLVTSREPAPSANYIHVQTTASDIWTIDHPLSKLPSVTLYDFSGNVMFADVQYVSKNRVVLRFSQPATGKATLN